MHPVLKRILVNCGLTASLLALIGLLFSHLAGMWAETNVTQRTSSDTDTPVPETVRVTVPLMMAFWGFVFVVVCELVMWRIRGVKPVEKPVEKQPDETEKLLNDLLARAEAARALEQGTDSGQVPEEKKAE